MKYYLTTCIFLLLALSSIAQESSKVIFFRHDFSLYRSAVLNTVKEIYLDGKVINKIKKNSIFIYEPHDSLGVYCMKPSKRRKLSLMVKSNSISFVQLKLYPGFFTLQSSIMQVSFADFKKIYEKKKWLRRKLAEQGYHSLDELVKGYDVAK